MSEKSGVCMKVDSIYFIIDFFGVVPAHGFYFGAQNLLTLQCTAVIVSTP